MTGTPPTPSLLDHTGRDLLERFAAGTTTPGAGSAAALAGALAASLVEAAARYTVRAAAWSEALAGFRERAEALLAEARERSERLRAAADEDAAAFERFWRLHRQGEADEEALRLIINVPLRIAEDCAGVAALAVELFDHGFRNARGETAAAALSALASGEAVVYAARLNLRGAEAAEAADTADTADTASWAEERSGRAGALRERFADLRGQIEARIGG